MQSTILTWHSVSSGRLLQVWRQAILAAQDGFERHLASSNLHIQKNMKLEAYCIIFHHTAKMTCKVYTLLWKE